MYTREKMTRDIYTVEPGVSLHEVYKVMAAMGIRHLPVVEGRRLVGVLSDRDIMLWSSRSASGPQVPHVPVSQVMTRDPHTCHELTPIETVAEKMLRHKIDCLPVVKDEELVGIISTSDLLELIARVEVPKPHQVIPIFFRLKPLQPGGSDGPQTA